MSSSMICSRTKNGERIRRMNKGRSTAPRRTWKLMMGKGVRKSTEELNQLAMAMSCPAYPLEQPRSQPRVIHMQHPQLRNQSWEKFLSIHHCHSSILGDLWVGISWLTLDIFFGVSLEHPQNGAWLSSWDHNIRPRYPRIPGDLAEKQGSRVHPSPKRE